MTPFPLPSLAIPVPRVSLAQGARSKGGFALIITILLLAFLVLLMVSMSALTRVETQLAANSQQAAAARENALLALNLALGKLQAAAGPDQRVTATAEIAATTQASKKKWTGVWTPTSATPATPVWLVSDSSPDATTAAPTLTSTQNYNDASGTVRLVGAGSTDLTVPSSVTGNEIVLSKQPLKASGVAGLGSGSATVGNYAWWIGDEGVKARINLSDSRTERPATTSGAPAAAAVTPTVAQKRQSLMVPGRVGGELLATDVIPPTSAPTYVGDTIYPAAVPNPGNNAPTATQANFLRDLGKLLTENQVELLGTGSATDLRNLRQRRFHDFTVSSRGVLADVAAGGLKKDLTAGLLASSIPTNAPANTDLLITVPAGRSNIPSKLPSWGALRSYVQMQNAITGSTPSVSAIAPSDTSMGVAPVVIHHQFWAHATIENGNKLNLLYFPAVVLWNPYDVTLKAQKYSGRFWFGLPPYRVYAEFTTATAAVKSWKWFETTMTTYGGSQFGYGSKGLVIDCPDLPPGKAYVFTPTVNQNYLTATNNLPLTLGLGWRTNFWSEDLTTATTKGQSVVAAATGTAPAMAVPSASDTPERLIIAISTSSSSFELFTNPTLQTIAPYLPQGNASQKTGSSVFSPSGTTAPTQYYSSTSGVLSSAKPSGVSFKTPLSENATPVTSFYPTGGYGRSVEVYNRFNGGAVPTMGNSFFVGNPAFGFAVTMKMVMSAADVGKEIAWLANYNPAAQMVNKSVMDGNGPSNAGAYGGSSANFNSMGFALASGGQFTVQTPAGNDYETFVGFDHNFGTTQTVLFHLPRKETGVLSLGALQHANVHPVLSTLVGVPGYCASAMPAYAIGNAYADPRIMPSEPTGFLGDIPASYLLAPSGGQVTVCHFDLSLLLNRLLWDKYYFSGVPTSTQLAGASLSDDPSSPTYYSANRRHKFYDPANQGLSAKATVLQDYDKAAANLLVEGAFNINSTSREAWRAVLASARNAPVVNQDGTIALANNSQTTPFPRSPYPVKSTAYSALNEGNADEYVGFRSLTDAQIDELATAIVAQIKLRAADSGYGPFRSLADFINRRPGASSSAYQLKGLLQAAIDSTTINGASGTGLNIAANLSSLGALDPKFEPAFFKLSDVKVAGSVPRAACLPGYLTQADLLQQLGPVLSARSDTFRVRTYGEVVNPATTSIVSRAWCEAIVQRLPEYISPSATAPESIPTVGSANANFGRRFKIISFRWLGPSDL